MAEHFLLRKESRPLSLLKVARMSEEEVRCAFAELRWGSKTQQTCPDCGLTTEHKYFRSQNRWRCKGCNWAFTVTSGTVFHRHRLPLRTIYAAIVVYANAAKGISALQLSRDLTVHYKTAFVLLHKLRESIFLGASREKMSGEVEVDAVHLHNYVRKANKVEDRVDLREKENRNQQECIVLVLRQRHDKPASTEAPPDDAALKTSSIDSKRKKKRKAPGPGAKLTRIFVLPSENRTDINAVIENNVAKDTIIFSDSHDGYADLSAKWDHRVVNHSLRYSGENGENENQAESYFARFRRMLMGQIHHHQRKYLDVYANEAAFREDMRRESNQEFTEEVVRRCLQRGKSLDWTGYWQGNHRLRDSLETSEVDATEAGV